MRYRPEIDGLRAVAVLPVIAFHAGLSLVPGGYVGVDVFFVISGFLITGIIARELDEGRFSLLNFYERRARRILPALVVMVAVSAALAWALLLPSDFEDFAESAGALALFSSNILFWHEAGYFDQAAELKPLLHTWSLAVEEQFYLFTPLALMWLWPRARRRVVPVLAVTALVSFAFSLWATAHAPVTAFYLLWGRAWELLAGSLLALWLMRRPLAPAPWHGAAAWAGLALIAAAMLLLDAETAFPGAWALLPVGGTVLVIAFAGIGTGAHRLLSARPLVAIGLVSYSAYLWHQPLFAFARYRLDEPGATLMLALAATSLVLAWLSWRFVERPWRASGPRAIGRGPVFAASVAAGMALAAFGIVGKVTEGLPGRLDPAEQRLAAYGDYDYDELYLARRCFLGFETGSTFDASCADPAAPVFVWGDSHAAALASGLRERGQPVSQFASAGCPPVLAQNHTGSEECAVHNDAAFAAIARLRPPLVVMHANWIHRPYEGLAPALNSTLRRVKAAAPDTQVVVLGGVPQWSPALPLMLVRLGMPEAHDRLGTMRSPLAREVAERDAVLREAVQGTNARYVSPADALCGADGRPGECVATIETAGGTVPSAWDYGHLTREGAALLAERMFGGHTSGGRMFGGGGQAAFAPLRAAAER